MRTHTESLFQNECNEGIKCITLPPWLSFVKQKQSKEKGPGKSTATLACHHQAILTPLTSPAPQNFLLVQPRCTSIVLYKTKKAH